MMQTTNQIQILGNKINCFRSYQSLYQYILEHRQQNSNGEYITVNNVHTMIEGFKDPSYGKIINQAFLSIPDGKPLQVVGRLKGNKDISRLFGPTLMEHFIDWGRQNNIRHFLFGSTEENLKQLKAVIETKYPGAQIVGTLSPPYRPVDEWDNELFVRQINNARPDFIWIGLGAPKQERWMYNQHKNIQQGILFGIGAGFDYLTGNIKHAPLWMKNLSLEWAYRLVQEPKRLWRRYLTTIPPFLLFSSLELMGFQLRKKKNSTE